MVASSGVGVGDIFIVVACDGAAAAIAPVDREVVSITTAQGQGDSLAVCSRAPY